MVEVKVLMSLANDEYGVTRKESARNGEWVKISIRKHENIEILKENQTLRKELKELTNITKTWLNSSNKVNQFFVKSSFEDSNVSKPNVEWPWLSKSEGFNLPNHDAGRILPPESQVNVTDSLVSDYDSAEESTSVCSTPLYATGKAFWS
ncbi:hypothetical protein Tco_1289195 [Tanacetum coccineum]